MSKLVTNVKTLGAVEGISCENATVEKVTVIKDTNGDVYITSDFIRIKADTNCFEELDGTMVTIKTENIISYKTVTAVRYQGAFGDIILVFNSNCDVNLEDKIEYSAGINSILVRNDIIKVFYLRKVEE